MKLFDAHCHLQGDRILPDLENTVARAAGAGVERMVCAGTSPADWNRVAECARRYPQQIIPMFGIHPWFADGATDIELLKKFLLENPSAGVGETGLDFQEHFTNRDAQEKSFAEHLKLAGELNRPVAVHCVRAWGRLIEILKETPAPKILLHAYSGAPELIPELVSLNCWFSFNAGVENPSAKKMRAAVVAVPENRLLIETDSTEPANLISVFRVVAELRKNAGSDEILFRNAQNFFTVNSISIRVH